MRATFHVEGVLALALLTVWSFVASVRERILPPPPIPPFPVSGPDASGAARGARPPAADPWRWN